MKQREKQYYEDFAQSLIPLSNKDLLDIYEGAVTVWGETHSIRALKAVKIAHDEVMRRLENK